MGFKKFPPWLETGARAQLVPDMADMRGGEQIANQLEAAGVRLAVQMGVHAYAIHERLGGVDCGGLRPEPARQERRGAARHEGAARKGWAGHAGILKRGSSVILRTVSPYV